MRRSTLIKKINRKFEQIKKLENEVAELNKQQLLLSDKTQQYKESEETFGRGKNKTTQLVGRVYWKEYFLDEDTGKKIYVQRSHAVKRNGVWVI